jgi:hypothetical protein
MQTRFLCAFALLTLAASASAAAFRDDSRYVARGPRTGYYIVRPGSALMQQLGLQGAPFRDTSDPLNHGRGADVLAFRLTPLVWYLPRRRTSSRGRLTTFTCGGLVLLSADAPPRMISKVFLGVRGRLKSGAMGSSLIIRSRFTTHSRRIQVGDASSDIVINNTRHQQLLTFTSFISSLWTPVLAEKS